MNDARLGSAESFAIASEDALGQAALVARGVHPPGSPVRAALERIAELEERIGALVHQAAEAAGAYPGASGTGRLGGIPTLIKDAPETAQRGLPLFLGSSALRDLGAVALVDSPLGARLRELGFVTLGVTKVPQLCFSTTTQPRGFTPVRNPWSLDHCAGGSSGGAAAAVAARLVPFASGTEDAGSIRIPASFCGVVGFKPSRGRVPLPEPHTYHRLHAFGLCRSIRDVACILDGIGTGSPRALFAREATGGFERRLTDGLPSLRIGLVTEAMGIEAHDDCKTALASVVPVLERLGCAVSDVTNDALIREEPDPARLLPRCGALGAIASLAAGLGRDPDEDEVEPELLFLARREKAEPTAREFLAVLAERRRWAVRTLEAWDAFDVVMSPAVFTPPPTLASRRTDSPEQWAERERRFMAFAVQADETGQPSVSLPLFWNAEGLPIGIQFTADAGRDDILLLLSLALERERELPRASATKNPNDYRTDRGYFEAVEYTGIADGTARLNALMTGEVDVINKVEPKTVGLLSRRPDIVISEVTGNQHYTFPMDTRNSPFSDNNVRLALKHAIDREDMVAKILSGHGAIANDHSIGPANQYYAQDLEQASHDPDKAKYYLKQAGIDSLKIALSVSEAAFPGAVDAGQLFQQSARTAGIEIELTTEPKDGYWVNVWMKKPFTASYWSGRATEDWMFTSVYAKGAPWNDAYWDNARFNELLLQGRVELDPDKRRGIYREMQEIVRTDGGQIIPMYANYIDATSERVQLPETVSNAWQMDGFRAAERWSFG